MIYLHSKILVNSSTSEAKILKYRRTIMFWPKSVNLDNAVSSGLLYSKQPDWIRSKARNWTTLIPFCRSSVSWPNSVNLDSTVLSACLLNKPSRLPDWIRSDESYCCYSFFVEHTVLKQLSSVQLVAEFSQDLLFDWMLPSLSLLFVTLLEHLNHNFRLENANTKILKKVYLTEFRQFKSVSILVKCCQRQRALHCFTGGCNIHNF